MTDDDKKLLKLVSHKFDYLLESLSANSEHISEMKLKNDTAIKELQFAMQEVHRVLEGSNVS